jgi:hypothetical protein
LVGLIISLFYLPLIPGVFVGAITFLNFRMLGLFLISLDLVDLVKTL